MIRVPDTSLKFKTIFRSLKYRNYRLFFSGQSISLTGTWMQRIAMPWLVYRMTGSELLLGVVSFSGQIPLFMLAPFAGVISDRLNKYRLLIATQVISMLLAFLLAALTLAGEIQLWQIILLSALLGCVNAFDVPTRHSYVVEMVGNREDLGNAIALNSLMFNGARIIGPSIAGLLLAVTNEGICFLLNAISYLFVVASLLMMKVTYEARKTDESRLWQGFSEGLRYALGFSPIKHLLLLLTVVSLTGMSYQVLMPVFAQDILKGGPEAYGFLMGGAGIGALAGALFLASRTTVLRLGRLVPAATLLFGTGLIALSFSDIFTISVALMTIIGAGSMLQSAASNTILQTITDDDKRGRIMSFYTMAVMGTAPFGSLLSGIMAKTIGTTETVLIFGLITILSGLLFLRKLPGLRNLVKPIYVRMGIIPELAKGIQKTEDVSAN